MELTVLTIVHNSTQCLDHIEKHIGAASTLIDLILGDKTCTQKLKAIEGLKMEFNIIKSDAERALAFLGD